MQCSGFAVLLDRITNEYIINGLGVTNTTSKMTQRINWDGMDMLEEEIMTR